MTSFELSINFFKKILQFFMIDFLHSKYAKRRRICGMSRADIESASQSSPTGAPVGAK